MHISLPSFIGDGAKPIPPTLTRLADFGANPGQLDAWMFLPRIDAAAGLPLVVVLHGCTQTAQGYDTGSGWSQVAAAHGFALLFPQQRPANNPNTCFNWFAPQDTRRGAGEVRSIAEMIETMIAHQRIDPQRVFITGLSAGGAMTSAMLATYPEMFAGGAILAGLPHGAAANVQEALQQMRAPRASQRTSGQAIRSASPHPGSWPSVSIWHGTADAVVNPSNADIIVEQWRDVHGLAGLAPEEGLVDNYPHRAWRGADGRLLVEEYRVTGMGHGTPLDTTGECACGQAGAFMLEAGISSTLRSARSWGLLRERPDAIKRPVPAARTVPIASRAAPPSAPLLAEQPPHPARDRVTRVIENALRAAGLMK